SFVANDEALSRVEGLKEALEGMVERLRSAGYRPDTRLVTRGDLRTSDDQEWNMCTHSEKIAIAFGLMKVEEGQSLRIYKNLRVCRDCHEATKLLSRLYDREIIVRDARRFHRFKDGECSCNNHW